MTIPPDLAANLATLFLIAAFLFMAGVVVAQFQDDDEMYAAVA